MVDKVGHSGFANTNLGFVQCFRNEQMKIMDFDWQRDPDMATWIMENRNGDNPKATMQSALNAHEERAVLEVLVNAGISTGAVPQSYEHDGCVFQLSPSTRPEAFLRACQSKMPDGVILHIKTDVETLQARYPHEDWLRTSDIHNDVLLRDLRVCRAALCPPEVGDDGRVVGDKRPTGVKARGHSAAFVRVLAAILEGRLFQGSSGWETWRPDEGRWTMVKDLYKIVERELLSLFARKWRSEHGKAVAILPDHIPEPLDDGDFFRNLAHGLKSYAEDADDELDGRGSRYKFLCKCGLSWDFNDKAARYARPADRMSRCAAVKYSGPPWGDDVQASLDLAWVAVANYYLVLKAKAWSSRSPCTSTRPPKSRRSWRSSPTTSGSCEPCTRASSTGTGWCTSCFGSRRW